MTSSRVFFGTLLALLLGVLIVGCTASSGLLAQPEAPAGMPSLASLPALPSGLDDVKHGTMMDNDTVLGDAFINSQNVTGAAGVGRFDGTPGLAWAIYQLTKRPDPAVPYALTINGRYLDPIPQFPIPGKGYYVGWSNYTAGRWEFSGPYTQDQARIVFPTTLNPTSPGGFIYAAVVCTGVQKCNVSQAQVGYFTGFGFEDYTIGAPQGEGLGSWCDIELDPAGVPQIAYVHGRLPGGSANSKLRVARLNGSTWEKQDIDTAYVVKSLQFAIGDNGLRALAVEEDVTHNLHVFIDNGTGTFTTIYDVATPGADIVAGITFVNGADDPTGDLDTVLCVYATPAAAPLVQTGFFRLTLPAGLPVSGLLAPVNTQEPGRITVTRRADGRAVCAVPVAPALPQWDATFAVFSAVADSWAFAVAPNWTNLDIADSNYQPEVVVRELAGGQLTAGYVLHENAGVVMSQLSGGLWSSDPADTIYTAHMNLLDFEPFPDGRVAVLANSPTMGGTLYVGAPASGGWQAEPLIPFPLGSLWSSLAIDAAGVCHIAIFDPAHSVLFYARREVDGTYGTSTPDLGGEASGISSGPVAMTSHDDTLHLFYSDIDHYKVLHAENVNGVWVREGETVNQDSFGYYPLAAGYIAGLDLLWVGYLNPLDRSIWAATKSPTDTQWQANMLLSGPQEFGTFAASDTELGVIGIAYWMDDTAIALGHGDPREGPFAPELVSFNLHVTGIPWLGYDTHAEQWVLAGQSSDQRASLFFERDDGGSWLGPYTVALQPGATGSVQSFGITVKPDGTRYVLVREQPDASTAVLARVYSAPPDSTSFSLYGNIAGYDTTLCDVGLFVLSAKADGEPVVGIAYKPLVDPTWTINAYASDGAGNFPPASLWTSPISDTVDFYGSFALGVKSTGAALAASEADATLPSFGRVYVHYPW